MNTIAKVRPRSEVIMLLIQPIANWGVRQLAKWRVNPLLIVLSHALCGFMAALLIVRGINGSVNHFIYAAILLQLKTLLDNMDGGLARATGQITQMGRYFDTGMDFLVNIALFTALSLYGSPLLSLVAFSLLTLILSFDYNAERLYKMARSPLDNQATLPIGAPRLLFQGFKTLYRFLLAPQDNLIARFDHWLFSRVANTNYEAAPRSQTLAWSDLFSTASLVNLGLSSQMFLLGVFLLVGKPFWYVYSIFFQALYVVAVQLVRMRRFALMLGKSHA